MNYFMQVKQRIKGLMEVKINVGYYTVKKLYRCWIKNVLLFYTNSTIYVSQGMKVLLGDIYNPQNFFYQVYYQLL